MKAETFYHVRAPNGVTVDWLESRGAAMKLATNENCEVYEIDSPTARAVKIRSAQVFKAREHENRRSVVTPASREPEPRQEIGFSFSQPAELAETV